MFKQIQSLTKVLADWIFPNYCFSCEKPQSSNHECLCEDCKNILSPTHGENWVEILPNSSFLSGAFSGWYFNETLQTVIHEIKYNGYARTGMLLGKTMGAELRNILSELDCFIPVPLHRVKKRERGFNQAEWIAKGIASHVNVPVESHLLKRVKYTQSQTTLSKEERNKNMEDAFQINQPKTYKFAGLVDDVLTTGSTANACASVLLKNGFDRVIVLSLATSQ
jgi:ComF family protein